MKNTFLLLFGFLMFLNSYPQTIKIRINNGEPVGKLIIDIPIAGYTSKYGLQTNEYRIDSASFKEINFNNEKEGIYVFNTAGVRFSLLLFPDDNLEIKMWINEKDYAIDVKGTNAAGHIFWLDYDRPRPKKILPVLAKFENEKKVENLLPIITNHIDSVVNKIAELRDKGLITKNYFEAITYYIKAEFGKWGLMDYVEQRWQNSWEKIDPVFLKYLDYMHAYNDNFTQFNWEILEWYNGSKYYSTVHPDNYHSVLKNYGYLENLPDELKEFAIADIIAFSATRGSNEINWEVVYKYYQDNYSKSKFLPFLNKYINSYLESQKNSNSSIQFVDTAKTYNNLAELIENNFKNKAVFIDLWATWCAPCRSEFAFTTELHTILKMYNIEILYLSIDNDKNKGVWEKFINNSQLNGYHYRAGKILYSALQKRFYMDGSISIPRYILIGQNGVVLDDNMPRPSSREVLFDRIKELTLIP